MPLEVTFHVPWVLEAFHARFLGRRNDPRNEAPHRTREKTYGTQGTFQDDHSVKGTMTRFCTCAHLDFWSGEPFFKISFWWKNPLPSTLRRPRKLLYEYSRAIWSILEVLNAIFCISVQALSRKFEVIEEKCSKAYYLLSVFLQTDQMWRSMWPFHPLSLFSYLNIVFAW